MRSPPAITPEERRLADRARQGQLAAFEELLALHWPRIYCALARVLGDPTDAVEVAGETFVKAWGALPGFRGEVRLATWLYGIAMEEAGWRLVREPQRPPALPSDEPADPREYLERCIAKLPTNERAAVVLRDIEGLTNEEAAEVLGRELSEFKTSLHRGRMKIRRRLEGCQVLESSDAESESHFLRRPRRRQGL